MANMNLKTLYIAAGEILAQKFVDAGIEDKPIRVETEAGAVCFKFFDKNYGSLLFRKMSGEVPEKGWKPDWVQAHLWDQMTQYLTRKLSTLPTVIAWCTNLIVDMDIDWVGLGIITMDDIKASFIDYGLIGRSVRHCGNYTYYFDSDLIYRTQKGLLGNAATRKL